eukprot:2691270-Pyramimonas_sp.AAC.1
MSATAATFDCPTFATGMAQVVSHAAYRATRVPKTFAHATTDKAHDHRYAHGCDLCHWGQHDSGN